MSSHVAGIIQLIKASFPSPVIGGISPPPVPPNVIEPYVTVQEIMGRELESLTGPSGLSRSIMQVNCWSSSYESAYNLKASIKAMLLAFTGTTPTGSKIQAVNPQYDTELYDSERKINQSIVRLFVWWEA